MNTLREHGLPVFHAVLLVVFPNSHPLRGDLLASELGLPNQLKRLIDDASYVGEKHVWMRWQILCPALQVALQRWVDSGQLIDAAFQDAFEELAPSLRRELLKSGDPVLIGIVRKLPEESYARLKRIMEDAE